MPKKKNGQPIIQPWDQFNRELVEQVHPSAWTNPKPASRYNLVVIGAGPGGYVPGAHTAVFAALYTWNTSCPSTTTPGMR